MKSMKKAFKEEKDEDGQIENTVVNGPVEEEEVNNGQVEEEVETSLIQESNEEEPTEQEAVNTKKEENIIMLNKASEENSQVEENLDLSKMNPRPESSASSTSGLSMIFQNYNDDENNDDGEDV